MLQRLRHMLIKEFIQVFRDPKMLRIIFLMPLMQLLIFGYAATTDVRNIATAVYDLDNSIPSREVIDRFVKSGYFRIVERVYDERQARALMDHGAVQAILRMNKGFGDQIQANQSAALQIIVDGTDSNTARIILDYSLRITGDYSQALEVREYRRLRGGATMPPQVHLAARAQFNENLESRNYYVPGVIAILVMLTVLMLTSMAVVREKEIGTMEQVMVTPIRPGEFILGKTVPFALIGFADVALISIVGVMWFDVPIRGSVLLLALAAGLYIMTAIGAGLLISTVTRTQQQAMLSTFFFGFPAILLSGFMFPIANMPVAIQWLTYLNPLRYFLVVLRGIFLKGVGLDTLWPQFVALAIMGAATLYLAARRFHKTLA